MNVSVQRNYPGLINNLLSGLFGTSSAANEINTYVQKNLDISNISKYLSTVVASSTTNLSSSQTRGDIVIDGIFTGNLDASQISTIQGTIKHIIDNQNKSEISRTLQSMFNDDMDVFQKKITSDFGGLFPSSGQLQVSNFVNNIKTRFEHDFNTQNITNTMNIISNRQDSGSIRIGPSANFTGNLDVSQKASITSITDTIQKSVSEQLLLDKQIADIITSVKSTQSNENKGFFSGWTISIIIGIVILILIISAILIFLRR